MTSNDHRRAERLILEGRIDQLASADRQWLEAHLEGCGPCAAFARSTEQAIRSLRSISVQVDPELVRRTRLLVSFRSRELERQGSWLLPVWVCCGLSWAMGIATAPLVWRGFEWLGHRAGLPRLAWESGFVLWWTLPALVTVVILAARKREATP